MDRMSGMTADSIFSLPFVAHRSSLWARQGLAASGIFCHCSLLRWISPKPELYGLNSDSQAQKLHLEILG